MTTRLGVLLLLLAAVLAALPPPSWASGKEVVVTETVQLGLADAFLAEGEYYRAITEYKKFLFLFPDSEKADYALFRVGTAYYRGEEYESATHTFAAAQEKYGMGEYGAPSAYFEGASLWKLGRFDRAGAAFDRVAALDPTSGYAPLSLIGKSLLSYDAKNVPGCRGELARFLESYPQDARAERVRQTIALLDKNGEVPRKSPAVAGVMSAFVPGSGYMYAGRYGDGVVALIVNGLFIAGTVAAIHQENYAVAAIVGGIGLPFYIGNIYGSANAATKWNIGVRKELREKIAVSLDYRF
jgi:TolA-binding protein/TM2 domain-containing membrane protein YozV